MRKIFLCLFLALTFLSCAGYAGSELSGYVTGGKSAANQDLDSLALFLTSDEEAKLPVIMYHLVTDNGKYIGRYGITPEALESDLKYLSDNGYNTVVMKDVLDFVNNGRPLPENPVMLTFDDGNTSDYVHLFPLLQKYKMKAIVSFIAKMADEYTAETEKNPGASYPNLTWPQLREMAESGNVEFQSHSYNLHGGGGAGMRGGEDKAGYKERLRKDLTRFQESCAKELGVTPDTFTYPLGVFNKGSEELLREMGFAASFSCTEGINTIKRGEPEGLFLLKRCIRPTGKNIAEVLKGIPGKDK